MLKPFHLVAALPLVVSACGSSQGPFYAQGCPADAAERVQAADWARVRTVTVRVQRDEFDPMIVNLTQNRAYVMRLENGDRESHIFRAPEFFKAIAMESATVGGPELAEPCPIRITLEADETAEFRFVAVRDGNYSFEDALFPITLRGGASGVITIESRLAFTVGALNPVKFEEPAPDATSAPTQPPAPVETAPSDNPFDNPFDTYQPPADDAGKAAPGAEPNPFDAVEPAPGAEPNPFDAVEPAPGAEPNPFDAVEPAPAEESNPFDAVEPAPAEEPGPVEAVEPAPAEESNPFDAVEPAPAEESNPFDAVEPAPAEESNPFDAVEPAPASPPPQRLRNPAPSMPSNPPRPRNPAPSMPSNPPRPRNPAPSQPSSPPPPKPMRRVPWPSPCPQASRPRRRKTERTPSAPWSRSARSPSNRIRPRACLQLACGLGSVRNRPGSRSEDEGHA